MKSRVLGFSLGIGACWSTSFHASDPAYRESRASAKPEFFVQTVPDESYRPVGILVVAPPNGATDMEIAEHAAEEGQDRGCHALAVRTGLRYPATWSTGRRSDIIGSVDASSKVRFTCLIHDAH